MKAIPERLKEALAREFTQEQIEEGFLAIRDEFQSGLADETVNRVIVGDRELRRVPHLVMMDD